MFLVSRKHAQMCAQSIPDEGVLSFFTDWETGQLNRQWLNVVLLVWLLCRYSSNLCVFAGIIRDLVQSREWLT